MKELLLSSALAAISLALVATGAAQATPHTSPLTWSRATAS